MVPVVGRWNRVELCECQVSLAYVQPVLHSETLYQKRKKKRGCKCVKNLKSLLLLPGFTNESWLLKLRN